MEILIIEDNESELMRLVSLLDGQDGHRVVCSSRSVEEAFSFLSIVTPGVIILDLGLEGISNEAAVKAVKAASPSSEILVFSASDDDSRIIPALQAGATGYLLKNASPLQIISAVNEIATGGAPMSGTVARKVLRQLQFLPEKEKPPAVSHQLSQRELEVLRMMYEGSSARHISERLNISSHTVNSHIKKIYEKLDVGSRSEAVYKSLQQKLIH